MKKLWFAMLVVTNIYGITKGMLKDITKDATTYSYTGKTVVFPKKVSEETEIKKASLTDMDQLLDWRIEVLTEVFSLPPRIDTTHLRHENRKYYSDSLSNGSHIACFAELHGEKIGCGGICIHQEMPSPDNLSGRCAYIMNIYVRKAYRRQGVGMKIVSFLIDQAKSSGIEKIYLETSAAGMPLYQIMGFVPMQDMVILKK